MITTEENFEEGERLESELTINDIWKELEEK